VTTIIAAIAALLLATGEPATALQREHHDDSIYIVRGTTEQLTRFHSEIAANWKGGELLTRDDAQGVYRYWAYADRTARQAREFMFGAMESALFLDMVQYDERVAFRAERTTLDDIAIDCGLTRDPFFITPVGELKVSFDASDPQQAVSCATQKLQRAKMSAVVKRAATQ
jgi:hypothetical protein